MKTKNCFLLCLIPLVFLGCLREEPIVVNLKEDSMKESNSFVSEGMVRNLIESKLLNTKASSSSYTLEVFTDSSLDTLMYIVNYGQRQGWQILSADVRVPAILAEGKSGSFSVEGGSPAFRYGWKA